MISPGLVTVIFLIILGGVLVFFAFTKLASSSRSKAKKMEMKKYYSLSEASEFFELGKYSQTVILAFKVLEFVLKDYLEGAKMENPTTFDLLSYAQEHRKLSRDALSSAHTARKVRNDAVHGKRNISREDALAVLTGVREVMREVGL